MSKVTSICGIPLGAGGMLSKLNCPKILLSPAISLSPWKTLIVTAAWLSSAVENIWLFFEGIVVFLSINFVKTPPNVSIPNVSGVTSSNNTSLTSPWSTPACIAAPVATTSSGFTPLLGSFPKIFFTVSITFGILVIPPTRITCLISLAFIPASLIAVSQGLIVFSIRSSTNDSNFDLDNVTFKCLGPDLSAVMKGKLISVWEELDSSIFAFSAPSFNLCFAKGSSLKSTPFSFLNSSAKKSIILLSKSSPPKNVSPDVDFTSNTPSPSSSTETSKVPPPKSYTAIVPESFLSRP